MYRRKVSKGKLRKDFKINNQRGKSRVLKLFKSDIMNHVLDVKNKYIIPGETSDIALIFIPSEQIYLEIFNLFLKLLNNFMT